MRRGSCENPPNAAADCSKARDCPFRPHGQGLCPGRGQRPGHDAPAIHWLVSDVLFPDWLVSDVLFPDWLVLDHSLNELETRIWRPH